MVNCQSIHKSYGEIRALKDISFAVEKGEIFGLIGPDGAGKTSLFRILTSLILADSGTATIDGLEVVRDYKELRKHIGYMPGRFSLYPDLTVEENLNFFATIFNTTIKENYSLIAPIYKQIEPFKTRRAGKLSGGMKQKLALSCALIHKPVVLFLDEPTTGVDPVSRKEFWEMLKNLKQEGITIIVSTPYMDEAKLCDRIALIQQGQILSVNTPVEIAKNYKNKLFALQSANNYQLLEILRKNPVTSSAYLFGEWLHVTFKGNIIPQDLPENIDIKEIEANIEDCFIQLLPPNPLMGE